MSDVSKSSFGGTMITVPLPLTIVVISCDGSDNPVAGSVQGAVAAAASSGESGGVLAREATSDDDEDPVPLELVMDCELGIEEPGNEPSEELLWLVRVSLVVPVGGVGCGLGLFTTTWFPSKVGLCGAVA